MSLDHPSTDPPLSILADVLDAWSGIAYVYDLEYHRNVYINATWGRQFGYTLEETGADPDKVLAAIIHPDDLTAVEAHHGRVRDQPDDTARVVEYRVRRADGQFVWLSSTDRPLRRDAAGRVRQLVGFAQDITRTRQLEQEKADHDERFATMAELRAAIIDNAVEGICLCEEVAEAPGIHFSVWNRRMTEISGYSLDEINRLGWYQTVYTDPETQARAADRMARMRLGEDLDAEEWTITRKDGSRRVLYISTKVVFDGRGTPRVLGVMHDVTDRVRLQQQLRDGQRMEAIGRLAGAVAHDFNNILAAILGGASLIAEGEDVPREVAGIAEEIVLAAERGADLTRQLLTLGRRRPTEMQPCDLAVVVDDALRVIRRLFGERIEVRASLTPRAFVRGDAGMLGQVVMNLCLNARDAMPGGGTLTVDVERSGDDEVRLRVRDTGVGIAAEDLPLIFEPFFTTRKRGEASGIGLATVYGAMTQHGGRITVTSSPGQGAEFLVHLPACPPPADSDPRPASPPAGVSVLLVEDMPGVRRTIRRLLESGGHRVIDAASADEAVAVFSADPGAVDLLLTDVALGTGGFGPELARRLTQQRPDLPVIFMSGFGTDLGGQALTEGVDFIAKPFGPDRLAAVIAARLAGRDGSSSRP
jgi:PAS domain S-box-containing protein